MGHVDGTEDLDGTHSLFWLQDVADPDLAFLTIVPWSVYPDYDIDIDADDVGGAVPDDLCVLAIVTVRRESGSVRLTSNLLAPVVIDSVSRRGRQVILQRPRLARARPLGEPGRGHDRQRRGRSDPSEVPDADPDRAPGRAS